MKEVEVVTLEDNNEYAIIDRITHNNKTYAYLMNTKDKDDICIRTIEDVANGYKITGLASEEEFDLAMSLLSKKYNN